jgi:hypothetical protein
LDFPLLFLTIAIAYKNFTGVSEHLLLVQKKSAGAAGAHEALRNGCKHFFSLSRRQQLQFSNDVGNRSQSKQPPGRHFSRQADYLLSFDLLADELMKTSVHANQGSSNIIIIRFCQSCENDSVKPKLPLMLRLIFDDPINGIRWSGVIRQDLLPHFCARPEDVIDRGKEHRFLIRPQSIQNVFPNLAPLRKLSRCRSSISKFAEDFTDDWQQLS